MKMSQARQDVDLTAVPCREGSRPCSAGIHAPLRARPNMDTLGKLSDSLDELLRRHEVFSEISFWGDDGFPAYAPTCHWHTWSIHQKSTEAWTIVDSPLLQSWVVARSQLLFWGTSLPLAMRTDVPLAQPVVPKLVPKHLCCAQTWLALLIM